jgi:alkylated DNA nucleotide flippase Atl1
MKKQEIAQRKFVEAAKKAGGALEYGDVAAWEAGRSAARWVRGFRRAKDRFLALVRAIRRDNKDADPDAVLVGVTEAVDALLRRKS